MIVGDTKTIVDRETASTAFIVSTATISITKPDNSSDTPNVVIDNQNSLKQHDLSTTVNFNIGGQYFADWSVVIGSQTLLRRHIYFASYFDIHSIVRENLQIDETNLSDSKIDNAIIFVNKLFIDRFPDCFTAYKDLSVEDRYNYDMALAMFAASILWDYTLKTTPNGALIEVTIENDKYKYANNRGTSVISNRPITDIYIDKGFVFLEFISCVKSQMATIEAGAKLFNKVGPRRGAREFLSQTTDPLYELIYDARLDRQ